MRFARNLAVMLCLSLLVPAYLRAEDAEKELFNGKDLTNFKAAKGNWKVADGVIVNEPDATANTRLETNDSFGDFEMTCKISVENTRNCEIQVHGYGQVFQISLEKGAWVDLKLTAKGADVKLTLNGQAVEFDKNDGKPDKTEGVIGFYSPKGGLLKIKDVKLKPLAK